MRSNYTVFCLIALWGVFPFVRANATSADEEALTNKRLSSIFQNAERFEQKKMKLPANKAESIEKKIGVKLLDEDRNPTFYIAYNGKNKPIGLVRFVKVKAPNGIMSGGVGLNMSGKVVTVEVYEHKESSKIAAKKFLSQFIRKGINDKFKVGVDIKSVKGEEAASQAVALMPQKTLEMSYALFFKKKETPMPDGDEDHEIEDLDALMHEMHDAYVVIREYFKAGGNQADAVKAAKQLWEYAKFNRRF